MNGTRVLTLILALCLTTTPAWAGKTATFGAGKDNTIFENVPNNSGGGAAGIFVGTNNTPSTRRGMLEFDIAAGVPAGVTITGVELIMYLANAPNQSSQTIGLHRLNLDWGENPHDTSSPAVNGAGNGVAALPGDATWNANFFGASTWPSPGATGSFNAIASGTAVVGGPTESQQKWLSTPALVNDVQNWLDAPSSNFGWALINANESSTQTFKAFYSRQATLNNGGTGPNAAAIDPAWRPRLTVTYIPEPGSALLSLLFGPLILYARRRKTPGCQIA